MSLPAKAVRKGTHMPNKRGTIALMGSGELTATMVEVHKALLRPFGPSAKAVFMDTPAGFQLNVDHIFQKASEYFDKRIQHPLELASFKHGHESNPSAAQQAASALRHADYMLIGPGSPTYALQQWCQSPIPGLMIDLVERGGCLVAASAAALTVGCATLPVYEIYKVGQSIHWVDGLDLLGHFGFNLVVVPHWNNAEGGNHDTRYCFMGASRLEQLEKRLPEGAMILGVDEHTALIIDLEKTEAVIRGVGRVTLRHHGHDRIFHKGDSIPLTILRGEDEAAPAEKAAATPQPNAEAEPGSDIWDTLHALAGDLREALDRRQDEKVGGLILALERSIWRNQEKLAEINEIGAAREVLRELITLLASEMTSRPTSRRACIEPLADAMIALRRNFRSQKQWSAADALRDALLDAGVVLSDTPDGTVWSLTEN